MAKKKKSRKRRPAPRGGGATRTAVAPDTAARDERRAAAIARREAEKLRRESQKRGRRLRVVGIVIIVVLLLLGALAFRVAADRRAERAFRAIADPAGCTQVRKTPDTGARRHLEGGRFEIYTEKPPTHGAHAGSVLTAGFYPDRLSEGQNARRPSLYEAVHSLEHGYVVAWFNDVTDAEKQAIKEAVTGESKVIAAAYPALEGGKLAMTAWARTMTCQKPDPKVIPAFAKRYRESRVAPEPGQP